MGTQPTLQDVATRAGVSAMTVSRALSAPHRVAAPTLDRIQQAITEVGYLQNATARSLAANASSMIAIIVSTINDPIFASTVDGLTEVAREHRCEVLLGQSKYAAAREEEVARTLLARRPDGLVLTADVHTSALRDLIRRLGAPTVEVWGEPTQPIDMVVGFSNRRAGATAAEGLARQGYRRVAFFGARGGRDRPRREGFQAAAKALGIDVFSVYHRGPVSAQHAAYGEGDTFFEAIHARGEPVDAVVCASDVLACAILFAAQRRGVRVPDDLAICGFGDLPYAAATTPALTTVRIPAYEMGRIAAEQLLSRLGGGHPEPVVLLDAPFVERDST